MIVCDEQSNQTKAAIESQQIQSTQNQSQQSNSLPDAV